MNNVLSAIFNIESEGFQAFTEIQDSLNNEQFFVPQMALVKYQDGKLKTLNSYESPALEDGKAFGGGLFGSLLGILGGPIGMLLCGTTGAAIGYASSCSDSEDVASLLDNVTAKLDDGNVAIVALVQEENESALDALLSKFDVQIIRRNAAFVAEEVIEAKEMEKELQKQLRAEVRARKKAETTEAIQQKWDNIKADFEAFKDKFKK